MRHVTVDLIRMASRRYVYNKKHGLSNTPPAFDLWGNTLPSPPSFPVRVIKDDEEKQMCAQQR